jgi:hypothetical protein
MALKRQPRFTLGFDTVPRRPAVGLKTPITEKPIDTIAR